VSFILVGVEAEFERRIYWRGARSLSLLLVGVLTWMGGKVGEHKNDEPTTSYHLTFCDHAVLVSRRVLSFSLHSPRPS
jgi:hypothetical protein